MNELDRIFSAAKNLSEYADSYLKYLTQVIQNMDRGSIEKMGLALLEARQLNKKIIFLGNGGSAATASHFVNDIAIGTRSAHKPFKAIALTDNVAIITAVGNDDGFDMIFTKQLEVYLDPGDLVVAISASGNSPNVVKAGEFCKARGNKLIGITGFDGGQLKKMCDISVHVQTNKGEYGPVEDLHMVLDHLLGSYLLRIVQQEMSQL